MAKAASKKKTSVVTETDKENKSVIVSQVMVMNTDRTSKDIEDWRQAMESAESVYYPVRAALYDIYSRIELDGVVHGTWGKRIAMVLNKRLSYYAKDGTKVEEMDHLIYGKEFRKLIRLIMESQSHGISGIESIPGPAFAFVEIPRKHIFPHKHFIGINEFSSEGIDYDTLPNVAVFGEKDDLGFLLKVAPYALWKQGNYGDWANFCEIFGQPFRIFEYDIYDVNTKKEAARMLNESGAATGLLIPKQLNFRMEDGKTSNANGDLQNKLKDALNDEIMIIILSSTETTKSSKSSGWAQSETHSDQQDEIHKCDLTLIENELNDPRIIRMLQSYLYPLSDGGYFMFENEVNVEELKNEKEIDSFLVNEVKLPLGDDYFYEKYGRPKPKNYNELKKKQEETQQPIPADPSKPDPVRPGKKRDKKEDLADDKNWMRKLFDFFVRARS